MAKGELVEALSDDGDAVLNADDPLVAAMAARTTARVWTFGRRRQPTCALGERRGRRPRPGLLRPGPRRRDRARRAAPASGSTRPTNAAATAAAALAAGLPLARGRREPARRSTASRGGGWRSTSAPTASSCVNDAYNANPDSMGPRWRPSPGWAERAGRRTVAVLGEMRELGGERRRRAPRGRRRSAHRLGIDEVVVVGARRPRRSTTRSSRSAATTARRATSRPSTQAGEWLRENVAGPDVVLVKASRAGRLERVADMLLGDGPGPTWERSRRLESDPAGGWPVPALHAGRHPLRDPGARRRAATAS